MAFVFLQGALVRTSLLCNTYSFANWKSVRKNFIVLIYGEFTILKYSGGENNSAGDMI